MLPIRLCPDRIYSRLIQLLKDEGAGLQAKIDAKHRQPRLLTLGMVQRRIGKQQDPRQICQIAHLAPRLIDRRRGQPRIFQTDKLPKTWQTDGQIISPVKLAGPQSLKDFVQAHGIATTQHKVGNRDLLKIEPPLPKLLDGPRLRPPH